MSFISIVTVNIEYGNKNRKLIKEKSDIIAKYNTDIILVQECDKTAIDFSNDYNYIDYSSMNSEIIDVYLKKKSKWIQDSIIEFNTTLSYTTRTCKIICLKNKITNQLIKIANIHLCGGRFDENDKIGGMLIGNLKTIRTKKNEIIEKLVNQYNVDIIAGDFNSDLICYLNNDTLQKQHLNYLQKISPKKSLKVYQEWNSTPYKYLFNNNYSLAFLDTNKNNYTSIYKTHPDSIWFKKGLFIQNEYKYIDLITNTLSDHNAIYTKLQILD